METVMMSESIDVLQDWTDKLLWKRDRWPVSSFFNITRR